MFKFNFQNSETQSKEDEVKQEGIQWMQSSEINIDQELYSKDFLEKCHSCSSLLNWNDISVCNIKYISSDNIVNLLPENRSDINPFVMANDAHSDLITAVYEGGLKVWECTVDLLNYIKSNSLDLQNKNVMDLGCGAGILGLYALLQGSFVYFQDYNLEIIKYLTIPNVLINLQDIEKVKHTAKFYCGDWKSFLEINEKIFSDEEHKFDFIFTSETIYNVNNYEKLVAVFKKCLKKTGKIYLAAKCHYFGVGGGLREFEDVLQKEAIFQFSTCWSCDTGMKREVLQITFKL